MSINIWIDNLTNFLTLFTKKLFSIFPKQLLHKIYAIWEFFHFYAFGNYAIWDVIYRSVYYPSILNSNFEQTFIIAENTN